MIARALRQRLMAADPDLGRFRMGARATIATGIAALLVSSAEKFVTVPATAVVLAAAMAMLATIFATDATLRARAVTTLLLVVPAVGALIGGTVIAPYPRLSLVAFVVTVFLAVFVRRFGARGTALGMMLFNAFFFALFFRAQTQDLAALVIATIVAIAVGFLVRFVVLPDRPKQIVRRSIAALRAIASIAFGQLADALTSPNRDRAERRVRRTLAKLNETALALEAEIDSTPPDALPDSVARLRARIFALEVATGRLTASLRELNRIANLPAAARAQLADALIEAARAIQGDEGAVAPAREKAQRAVASSGDDPLTKLLLARASTALDELLEVVSGAAPGEAMFAQAVAAPKLTPSPSKGLNPSTRQAIQAALAAAVAMAIGRWISPDRWFWAVLAAFIVLTRATTTEEIIVRAWHRVAGTVVGVLVGMLLAAAVHGHPRTELGLLFVCVFLAFHSLRGSYSLMVLWITAVLALLYGLLGRYTPGLLVLRIEETFAGAIVGAIVAALVLPTRTHNKVSSALLQLLGLYSEFMAKLSAGTRSVVLQPEARRLDTQLQELRTAAEPLSQNVFSLSGDTVSLLHGASGLVFYARQLAAPEWNELLSDDVRQNAAVLARNSSVLQKKLQGDAKASFEETAALRDHLRQLAAKAAATNGNAALTAIWLRRMDELLVEMCRTVGHRGHRD